MTLIRSLQTTACTQSRHRVVPYLTISPNALNDNLYHFLIQVIIAALKSQVIFYYFFALFISLVRFFIF